MGFKPYRLIREWFLKKNVRIRDYESLGTEDREFVDYTIKNSLRPNPRLRIGRKKVRPKHFDLWAISWSDLILTRKYLGDNEIKELLKLHYGLKEKEFLLLNMFNAFAVYKWIAERVKEINDVEKAELDDEPTDDEKEAGVQELERYDYAVALDSLSKGQVWKEEELLQMPYSVIFRKLCLNRDKAEIQRKYQEIVSRKAKRGVPGY